MSRDHSWLDDAVCTSIGEELFFPAPDAVNSGGGRNVARHRAAVQVCSGCPVWQECRIASVGEDHGTWAGTSPGERSRFRGASGLTSMEGCTKAGTYDHLVYTARRQLARKPAMEALAALWPHLATQPYFHDFEVRAYVPPLRKAAG